MNKLMVLDSGPDIKIHFYLTPRSGLFKNDVAKPFRELLPSLPYRVMKGREPISDWIYPATAEGLAAYIKHTLREEKK